MIVAVVQGYLNHGYGEKQKSFNTRLAMEKEKATVARTAGLSLRPSGKVGNGREMK